MNKFFTADQHFNHKNIIQYCQRSFKNVDEMNETLINNWNAKIKRNDFVYVLGDMIWQEPVKEILDKLNGRIIYIYSMEYSHEAVLKYSYRFEQIIPLLTIKIQKFDIYITMCHYCMRAFPKSHYNQWHLFGHSHGRLESIGKTLDVGVDSHNFYPWSLEEVIEYMATRPDNPAYTKIRGFYRQKLDEEEIE